MVPSLNCIWKYRLRNDDHLSSVSVGGWVGMGVGGWWVGVGVGAELRAADTPFTLQVLYDSLWQ